MKKKKKKHPSRSLVNVEEIKQGGNAGVVKVPIFMKIDERVAYWLRSKAASEDSKICDIVEVAVKTAIKEKDTFRNYMGRKRMGDVRRRKGALSRKKQAIEAEKERKKKDAYKRRAATRKRNDAIRKAEREKNASQ